MASYARHISKKIAFLPKGHLVVKSLGGLIYTGGTGFRGRMV
jgi:hypothetical protein